MEQVVWQEETPFLALGGTPAWVFSSKLIEIKMTPEGQIGNSVSTAGPLGEFLFLLP